MPSLSDHLSRPAALLLSPILLAQGRALRRRMPLLPEASGARTGTISAITSTTTDGSTPTTDGSTPTSERMLSLLIFGESTAAGVGVTTQEDGIVGALARRLATPEAGVNWAVTARTGYTAASARGKLLKHVRGEFDLIVVLLGVNDSLGLTPRRNWSANLTAVLAGLRRHLAPRGRMVCAGVPQMTEFRALPQPTRRTIGRHARTLDHALIELLSDEPGVSYVDSPTPTEPDALASDGFHPSHSGYEQWAEHLVVTLRRRGELTVART